VIKACLNGSRDRREHPGVPLSADELAAAGRAAADAGAAAVHIHPRDDSGAETLAGWAVSAAVAAIGERCPGLPIGVSTGAWIEPSQPARLAAIRSWSVLPDFASVNVHESGAAEVALALAELGVGVEAGVWWPAALPDYLRWPVPCLRILVECVDTAAPAAVENAYAVLAALPADGPPVLLHGAGSASWPVLREALRLGLDTRIGLEDTLVLPDGSVAPDNAALVAAAVELAHGG
jgi:uncharacterized protein (DUF849 family)